MRATSPSGARTLIRTVPARAYDDSGYRAHRFGARIGTFSGLADFRTISIVAVNDEHHISTYLTIHRTP